MQDPTVRSARAAHIYAPHVEPINRLVDRIGDECGHMNLPYLDPSFGGTDASVLLMLKAPEADADPNRSGPRFLSLDNDDSVAARIFETCQDVGLDRSSLTAWNICPFPIAGSSPSVGEFDVAAPYNLQMLKLLSNLKAIVLLGTPARNGWRRMGIRNPDVVIFEGASPSPPGINQPANLQAYDAAMRAAAAVIRGDGP